MRKRCYGKLQSPLKQLGRCKMRMILYCRKCGNVWPYQGSADRETSCPTCKGYVHLKNRRVDQPLPTLGDYSNAVYLGVSNENSILHYDERYALVVEFFGEPDPYSRSEETKVPKEQLSQWLKDYHWNVGFKYRPYNIEQ